MRAAHFTRKSSDNGIHTHTSSSSALSSHLPTMREGGHETAISAARWKSAVLATTTKL
jgi:hypothetical protein